MDDGSCEHKLGCTNEEATNFDWEATKDDESCEIVKGCMDEEAENYNFEAVEDLGLNLISDNNHSKFVVNILQDLKPLISLKCIYV